MRYDLGRAWPPLVPAVALPALFLHLRYQPRVEFGLGSTAVGVELSDVAVLVVVAAGAFAGLRYGWQPLRPGRWLWLLGALFLGLVVASTFHPLFWQEDYRFLDHLVTAATFCEYALLAPALPLLVRRGEDSLPLLWTLAGWSAAASGWGLLQFGGLVTGSDEIHALQREPSFVGIHDFAALSGAAFVLALAILALAVNAPRARALAGLSGTGGALGLILAGSVSAALGIGLAAAATLWIARRRGRLTTARGAAVVSSCIVIAASVPLMRSGELSRSLRDLGFGSPSAPSGTIESYGHRSLLAYIGLRIFLDHPVFGVGWQGSQEPENYRPYLEDARRRYPNAPAVAFPSPEHEWGTQNAYLQAAADLGLVGLVALISVVAAGVLLGMRAALAARPELLLPSAVGLLWLLVAAGVWNGMGIVAGVPLDALSALGFGLVAAAAAWRDDVQGA